MELIPPREGQCVFLVNHPSSYSNQRVDCDKCGMSNCKACNTSLEDIAHFQWSCLQAQEVWTRSSRSATFVWLPTESAAWFHGWNGNSPLNLVHGTLQPSTLGGSFYIQEQYEDNLATSGRPYSLASVGIKMQESFIGKRAPPAESLMMIQFYLISTLQGEFESITGPQMRVNKLEAVSSLNGEVLRCCRWWMVM